MKLGTMPRYKGSPDVAMTVVRVVAGLLITFHGWSKVRAPGVAQNFQGFVEFLGLPAPSVLSYVVAYLELVGGILIIAGLITRIPALLLAIQMCFTSMLVKLTILDGVGFTSSVATQDIPAGSSLTAPAEVDFLFLVAFAALVILGPGKYSLDYILGIERGEAEAGGMLGRAREKAKRVA